MMNSSNCHLCGRKLFSKPIIRLEGMPKAAQYYPNEDEFTDDTGIDLVVYQCSFCGLVQLNDGPVPYYKEVITAASISEKARETRHLQMQSFIDRFRLHGKTVLDMGCGKGEMLEILEDLGSLPVGIEASYESAQSGLLKGRNIINGYIGDMDIIDGAPFDAFISLNYLEHLPKPGSVIRSIYSKVAPDAVGFVTVPNLDYLLDTKCFYEFVADHLSYFTLKTLPYAFESNGFDVLNCYTINNENDIAAVVRKGSCLDISKCLSGMELLTIQLKKISSDYASLNKKVAVWGAGHRTLALLALSKLHEIAYVVDSAKFKQGKVTPVLHHKILAPERLKEEPVDLVIIMVPGLYPDEVLKTLRQMDLGVEIAVLRDNKIEFQ